MTDAGRTHPLSRIEDAVAQAQAEQEERSRWEMDSWRARVQKIEEEQAARTARLRTAVQAVEGPFHALLSSPEWTRTLAVMGLAEGIPLANVDVPVHADYRLGYLSFGPTVTLKRKCHVTAPVAELVLKVEGTLLPIITWWETGSSNPQEAGSRLIDIYVRREALPTVIRLCALLSRGRLLRVIQSTRLRRMTGVPLYRRHHPRKRRVEEATKP